MLIGTDKTILAKHHEINAPKTIATKIRLASVNTEMKGTQVTESLIK